MTSSQPSSDPSGVLLLPTSYVLRGLLTQVLVNGTVPTIAESSVTHRAIDNDYSPSYHR
jgi:hypothetical protein